MVKKLLSNSIIYAIGPQIPQIVSLLMLPILTPHLTSKDYGIYGVIMAYMAALSALKDLGLAVVLSNTFYKLPNRYPFIWQRIYGFISLWAIPLSLIFAFIIWIALPVSEKDNYLLIAGLYCLPVLVFDSTKLIGAKYFQLKQTPIPAVTINIVAAFAGILSNLITIKYLKMGYLGWLISGFVIALYTFIPYLYIVFHKLKFKPNFDFNYKWLKRYLKISLPVLPHFYALFLLDSSDRLILNWYKIPIEEIGIYNLGYTFGGYFAIVGFALGNASGPMYIELYAKKNEESDIQAKNLTFLMQIGILALGFSLALWLKEFFNLLIKNNELVIAYSMGVVILMSYTYRPIYSGSVSKLIFLEKTNQLWKLSFTAGVINIICNIIFIPIFGIWAAVLSTFAAMMFIGFRGYFLKEFKLNNSVDYKPWLWFLLICGSTILVFLLKDINWIIKVFITIGILGCLVPIFQRYRHLFS